MTNITKIVEVKIMMITQETNKLTHTVTNMWNKKTNTTTMEKNGISDDNKNGQNTGDKDIVMKINTQTK